MWLFIYHYYKVDVFVLLVKYLKAAARSSSLVDHLYKVMSNACHQVWWMWLRVVLFTTPALISDSFTRCKTILSTWYLQQEGVTAERRTRAKAWLHFTQKRSGSSARCKINISRKGGNIFLWNTTLHSRNAVYLTLVAQVPLPLSYNNTVVRIMLEPSAITEQIVFFD